MDKTSVTAAFAAVAGNVVTADCNADAADLHPAMVPTIKQRAAVHCGHAAVIRAVWERICE